MRTVHGLMVASLVGLSACAPAMSGGSADNITRLEHARSSDPKSEPAQRSLGVAYFKAGRYDEALAALQQAATANPRDGVAALYLGLTAEAKNDLPRARSAYESYLKVGKTRGVKNQISARLAVLARKENEVAAKQAMSREQQLTATPGSARTVAVMPFRYTGSDTSYKPLERGFAELVTTDLARSSQLTVVERERLQALLDELQLQQSAGVEAGTGVRAGKILQAGRFVGGTISQPTNTQLRADAFVTNVQTTQTVGTGARDEQAADQLFAMEKNVVLSLFNDLGVQLSTAERNAIEQRPTRSLQAFLSYSRGLELEDQGRYDEAARFYDNAVRIDPNFRRAAQKSKEAKDASAGAQVTVATVEAGLNGSVEGGIVAAATQGVVGGGNSSGGAALATADALNPSTAAGATTSAAGASTNQPTKDPAASTGADNVTTKTGKVTIVIHQPGQSSNPVRR